jgi:hypothetical protein
LPLLPSPYARTDVPGLKLHHRDRGGSRVIAVRHQASSDRSLADARHQASKPLSFGAGMTGGLPGARVFPEFYGTVTLV